MPPYLADNCQLLADTGRRTHSSLGDSCFAVAGPSDLALVVLKLLVVRVYLQCKVALAVGSDCLLSVDKQPAATAKAGIVFNVFVCVRVNKLKTGFGHMSCMGTGPAYRALVVGSFRRSLLR